MKNDSPPSTDRRSPFMMPPCVLVAISTFDDIAIIAPASALADSPWSRWTVAMANDGLKLISVLTGPPIVRVRRPSTVARGWRLGPGLGRGRAEGHEAYTPAVVTRDGGGP